MGDCVMDSNIKNINTDIILDRLDKALDYHMDWLQRWHRAIICDVKPDDDITHMNSHKKNILGNWLYSRENNDILTQPAFDELAVSFKDIHDFAKILMKLKINGKLIPVLEYNIFMEKINNFTSLLRRMQHAFRKANSELDPLTGLHNRQIMLQELNREYIRSIRNNIDCAIILADIDHFKLVNDNHGHGAGDKVLSNTAGQFISHLRPYDSVYRYGGEEFLIILPDTDKNTAVNVLERLRQEISNNKITIDEDNIINITMSFGVAMISSKWQINDIIKHADQALYQAKADGRNKIFIWNNKVFIKEKHNDKVIYKSNKLGCDNGK